MRSAAKIQYDAAPELPGMPLVRNFLAGIDYPALIAMLLLLAVGVLFIYTTGMQVGTDVSVGFWKKQLAWIGIGGIGYLAFSRIDYRFWIPWSWFFYGFGILCLAAVFFVGKKVNGAWSWIDFGPIQFQPSELAKLTTIMMISALWANPLFHLERFWHLLLLAALLALPIALIAAEPDFGSAVVLIPVGAVMAFTFGISRKWVIGIAVAVLLAGTLFTLNEVLAIRPVLKNYQRERILTFLDPERDIANRGYNAYQSRLAVGSGSWFGKGLGKGTQNPLGFLPQSVANNDFIFSVMAEETGFVGTAVILLLYGVLLYTILRSAFKALEPFGRGIGIGIATMIFTHVFINVGMSVGVMPITGIPLPLLSYGGSFVVSLMLGLGLMQSVYRVNRNLIRQEED